MSTGSASDLDPRYDPRFQRGYTDAAAPPPGPAAVQPAPTAPPAPTAEDAADDPEAPVAAADDPEAAELGSLPHGEAKSLAGSDREEPIDGAPANGERAEHAPSAAAPDSDIPDPDPDPDPDTDPDSRHERLWFNAGWLLSGFALALGSWWQWAVNSNPDRYTGISTDVVFEQLAWSLAPALMQAGVLGLVLVTSLAAAHQLDRSVARVRAFAVDGSAAARGGFWRTPGIVALVGIVAVSVIILIWLIAQVVNGVEITWDVSPPSDDDFLPIALSGFASSAIGPVALAAMGSALGIILLGARSARRARALSGKRD